MSDQVRGNIFFVDERRFGSIESEDHLSCSADTVIAFLRMYDEEALSRFKHRSLSILVFEYFKELLNFI